nr:hypothetical protein BaRGS_007730 [Batillaria attramentaria]
MSRLWRDSISVSLSRDGLRQLRIAYRGVLALETSQLPPPVTSNSTSTQNDTQHVPPVTRLLQVTDGRRVVQTVVQGMAMTDCRTSRDPEDVLSVLDQYLRNHPRDSILGDVFAAYDSGDLSALFNITGVDFRFELQADPEKAEERSAVRMVDLPRHQVSASGSPRFEFHISPDKHAD